jgi:GT2 family glycosyltransferase
MLRRRPDRGNSLPVADSPLSIAVGIPTITAGSGLHACVNALHGQRGVVPDLVIVRNGPAVEDTCAYWESRGVEVHRPDRNLGVAASWNHACRRAWERGHDAVVLLNDDVVFTDGSALARFRGAVNAEPRELYLVDGLAFAAFCVTRAVWDEVGDFDEEFWPAYYEDCDWHYRAKLRGIAGAILEVPASHESGATRTDRPEMQQLIHETLGTNHERYVAKWGGIPGHETFTVPWNCAAT